MGKKALEARIAELEAQVTSLERGIQRWKGEANDLRAREPHKLANRAYVHGYRAGLERGAEFEKELDETWRVPLYELVAACRYICGLMDGMFINERAANAQHPEQYQRIAAGLGYNLETIDRLVKHYLASYDTGLEVTEALPLLSLFHDYRDAAIAASAGDYGPMRELEQKHATARTSATLIPFIRQMDGRKIRYTEPHSHLIAKYMDEQLTTTPELSRNRAAGHVYDRLQGEAAGGSEGAKNALYAIDHSRSSAQTYIVQRYNDEVKKRRERAAAISNVS